MSRLEVARLMSSMLKRLLRRELPGRRSERKLGRRSVQLLMRDEELRKPNGEKRRRESRRSRRRNVRRERLGRRQSVSAKRKNFETETASVTGTEKVAIAIGIGIEIEIEIGIGIGIGTETEIERIDTEDTRTIPELVDMVEMAGIAEIPAEILSRSQSCQKRRLSDLSRRL